MPLDLDDPTPRSVRGLGTPSGSAGVGCRLLDPVTGETLTDDTDDFGVVGGF